MRHHDLAARHVETFDQPLLLSTRQAGAAIEGAVRQSLTLSSLSRLTRTAMPISAWRSRSSSGLIYAHASIACAIGICTCRDGSRCRQPSPISCSKTCPSIRSARAATGGFASSPSSRRDRAPRPMSLSASARLRAQIGSIAQATRSGNCCAPCICVTTSRCRNFVARYTKSSSVANRFTRYTGRSARRRCQRSADDEPRS